jgi:uncharacterized membrane protein
MWIAMAFMMLLFWAVFAAVVVAVLLSNRGANSPGEAAPSNAAPVLDERFSRGGIDVDDDTRGRDLLGQR